MRKAFQKKMYIVAESDAAEDSSFAEIQVRLSKLILCLNRSWIDENNSLLNYKCWIDERYSLFK